MCGLREKQHVHGLTNGQKSNSPERGLVKEIQGKPFFKKKGNRTSKVRRSTHFVIKQFSIQEFTLITHTHLTTGKYKTVVKQEEKMIVSINWLDLRPKTDIEAELSE